MLAGQAQFVVRHLRRATAPECGVGDGELLDAFLIHRDEAAFAALLRRHGPMVWGVCRRFAGQLPDAEDAFQAVFLILVRKGHAVRPRERVGAWLHGVALRVARKARRLAERRRAREKQVRTVPERAAIATPPDDGLGRVIDEELCRLPERLRLPVLLCDVEGRPQREAARHLRLPVGTLGHRLAAARRLLARRLARRGVALSLAGLAAVGVPRPLAAVTGRAALTLAARRELAALVPPQIVALTEGALIMTPSKFRLAAALTFIVLFGGLGLQALQRPAAAAGEDPKAKAPPAAKAPAEPPADDLTFLRRLSLDLRNMLPTMIEMNYFVADKDPAKRRKVAGWMLESADGWKRKANVTEAERDYDRWLRAYSAPLRDDTKTRIQRYEEEYRKHLEAQQMPPKPAATAKEQLAQLQRQYGELKTELGKDHPQMINVSRRIQMLSEQLGKSENAADEARLKEALKRLDEEIAKLAKGPEGPDEAKRARQQIERGLEYLKRIQSQPEKPGQDAREEQEDSPGSHRTAEALFDQLLRQQKPGPVAAGEKLAEIDGAVLRAWLVGAGGETEDATFLRRLSLDVRGLPPTAVEMHYFLADKDPKKRQKLVDWLLADPETAKQIHRTWEKFYGAQAKAAEPGRVPDRLDKLLQELLAAKRNDEQILEALTLATLARLPTEGERLFVTGYVKSAGDRAAAWDRVLYTLTASQEFRQHAAALQGRAAKK